MAILTDVTIKLDHLDRQVIRFVTNDPYRSAVLRVLSIFRNETGSNEDKARLVCEALTHIAVFPGDEGSSDFHVCVSLHDHAVFFGHNEDRESWGNVHFTGHTDDITWDAGDDSTGRDWLDLMRR